MNVSFSIVRPYCNSLDASGYYNLHENWYWTDRPLQSGVRVRPYHKNSKYIIVITELSKHPKIPIDDIFNTINKYIISRISLGWKIDKIVFQKGGIPIPAWFIDFLNKHGIKLVLISDDGNGHIVEEVLN